MLKFADVIVGLSYGDEGKGKVTNTLLKKGDYTHCVRFNGGHNAGHTIYKDGKKIVTHAIPTGVVQGVRSIIGPGCVANPRLLEEEISELRKAGVDLENKLFIDKRTNLIMQDHLAEDGKDKKIGTTKKGNGPAYRDKYARKNLRFGEFAWKDTEFKLVDIYEELYETDEQVKVLMEGAQAFGLDIDWGDYPYVTSSHCGVGGAVQNGVSPDKIHNVFGVCKAYDTYVGAKEFEGNEPVFKKIREIGNEFGATTGRPRQVGFLDLDNLVRSARINGVTWLIMNKVDILEEVDTWKLKTKGNVVEFKNSEDWKLFISDTLTKKVESLQDITYSSSPEDI